MFEAIPVPKQIILSAPWTGFHENGSLNLEIIPQQASFARKNGVNVVWISGGMAQWDQLTVAERKSIMTHWISAGHAEGLYVIVHVGAVTLGDAQELARYATHAGADAIAVIPTFGAERLGSLDQLIQWVGRIAGESHLPCYYYHIPGTTGYYYPMQQFLVKSASAIPTLAGIKYVESNFDDFRACVQLSEQHSGKYQLLWAPEPKLAGMPFGAHHVVLAESYFGPYVIAMLDAYEKGDMQAAIKAQAVRDDLASTMGGAGKYVMKMLGIDLGPPRLPAVPMTQSTYDQIYTALQNWGFFNHTLTG